MHGSRFETVRCVRQDATLDKVCEMTCLACFFLSYIGLLFLPAYLSYKLSRANEPEPLELIHHGGRRDDPRGEQNRAIAAPPGHTSV